MQSGVVALVHVDGGITALPQGLAKMFGCAVMNGLLFDIGLIMMNRRHSGFNVYCGKAIWPRNQEGLENLARYTCPPQEDHPRLLSV
jgi:hypothetical protein